MGIFGRIQGGVDRWQRRHRVAGFLFAVRQKYTEDQGGYLAATVTYYAFFSIFPLLLVFTTLLGYALEGDSDLQQRVLDSALADFPVIGPQLQDNVTSLQGSAPALAVGLAVALWAGIGVCLALENAFDQIWGVPFKRRANAVLRRVRALIWLAVLGVIMVAGTLLGALSTSATSYGPGLRLAALVVSLAVNLAFFLLAFRVLTSERRAWRDLLPGTVVAALAWEALQTVGGYYVDRELSDASSTYGVFALVIGLLSWLYVAATVTLLAAEINVVAARGLWPRSFALLGEEALTPGDEDALRQRAGVEERRSDEDVNVAFDPPERGV
jgi:membrane protein